MQVLGLGLIAVVILSFFTSCAPVKFSRADVIIASTECVGEACLTSSIVCDPKINSNQITFSYVMGGALPSISSNCTPIDVDYSWVVKRADASVIAVSVPGLIGANPANVDFTGLGQGSYYVYLTAAKTGGGLNSFVAARPLEFVVPGSSLGNSLTCAPKLNANFTTLALTSADPNAVVTANCVPPASSYAWTATKNGAAFVIAGLSGATSTPDIKSHGPGEYKLSLYATAVGSTHWQSTTPLIITIADPPPPMPAINCNPRINGPLTNVTLTSASPNPLISSSCFPSTAAHTWTVTRSGTNVSVPGLIGANSNPNFLALGSGTYLIYLTSSMAGYKSWTTTMPLTITVDASGAGLTLNCAPRLNDTSVALTITPADKNPVVTSGCVPSSAIHTWRVYKAGTMVVINGLSGATSSGDFLAQGIGTYLIYLNATAPNYNSFSSQTPLELTIAPDYNPVRVVTYEKLVQATDNKVDILLVVDDSKSMAPENTKLAQKLKDFVADLTISGIDWQICATVTRSQDVYNNGVYYWGASRNWVKYVGSPSWILKTGAADPNMIYEIFTDTVASIGAGWAGTDDERGIKAAWWSAEYSVYNQCYRPEASLAVILISDEDERSVGGNSAYQYYTDEFKTLEVDDQPQEFVNKIKQKFGVAKRFTFNSIIVKPGDTACMAAQDAEGSKAHYGHKYSELSQLTGGAIASICDADYAKNLYYFKDRIVNTLASVPLECAPSGDISITITPLMNGVITSVQNNNLVFNPAVPAGRTIKVIYNCPRS